MRETNKDDQSHTPPVWIDVLLENLLPGYELEDLQGDLYEIYQRRVALYGIRKANWIYLTDVIRFLPPFARLRKKPLPVTSTTFSMHMISNYLVTALRDARRNTLSWAINLLGLSLGMAAFLVIVQFVLFERSFDAFHENAHTIYRVPYSWEPLKRANPQKIYASNVPAFGPALKNDFPQVVEYSRLFHVTTIVPYCILSYDGNNGQKVSFNETKGYYADPGFLTMFSFPLLSGDKETALDAPKTILLTESAAIKYFGKENPVGKILHVSNEDPSGDYLVTGVLKDIPANSHLQFDFLLSYASLGNGSVNKSWGWSQFYTYIQLKPDADAHKLEAQFPAFLKKHTGNKFESEVFLQPLRSIHLSSHLRYETSVNGSAQTVDFLLIIALLIIAIAWINYINLSSAKALQRAREVGVRKAIGASGWQVFFQFLMQSFTTHVLALCIALLLLCLFIPLLISHITSGIISLTIFKDIYFWWIAAGLTLAGAVLSGIYPSLLLASFRPIEALKGKIKKDSVGLGLRKILVTAQFSSSVIMAIFTLIVIGQYQFMINQNLGIDIEQTLVLNMPGSSDSTEHKRLDVFKQALVGIRQVKKVSFSTSVPGKEITTTRGIIRRNGGPTGDTNFFLVGVDDNFIDFFDLTLLAGRPFDKEHIATDKGSSVIINEQALELLQLTSPGQAIGEKVLINGRPPLQTIVGVIKNYHNKSLTNPYEPIVLYPDSLNQGYLTLKLENNSNLASSIEAIEALHQKNFANQPLDYFFLDDFFNRQYQSEKNNIQVFSFFAMLAILIACLGMIGLTTYSIGARMKEIAVRKVLGAHTSHVLQLLLKDLLQTIIIASILAWPVALLITKLYLDNYAFRIQLNPFYFILPSIAVALIALLSILHQTWKAANLVPTAFLKDR